MKLAVAGQSYTNRSLAAAAQQSINLYQESIENPDGSGKSLKILRGIPGYTSFANLNSHSGVVRGLFSCGNASGGGRCFVVVGQWLYEINESGSILSSHDMGSAAVTPSATLPAQMFGNGNQLGIVSGNQFYIDNGGGPSKARFQLNGTVGVAGTAVTWVAGDKFPAYTPSTADPLPTVAYINNSPVKITFTSATTATLAVALAGGSGTVTFYGDSGMVFWESGTVFDHSWEGAQIVIDSLPYTIDTIVGPYQLIVRERPGGYGDGLAWAVTIGNNSYSTAGGPLVTALTGAYLDETFYVQRPPYPQNLYTDLAIDAVTDTSITSTLYPFTSVDIGSIINITSGTGFTVQSIQIIDVIGNVATADRPVGTVGSTGGHGTSQDLGRQVNFSAVLDGTSWSGLDFFNKEYGPDYIQSIFADRGQLYVFGFETSEVWQNSTATGRPERVNGAEFREGSACRWGTVSMSGHIYFIGGPPTGSPVAFRLDGYTPTRISTHAIEEMWATNLANIGSSIAWDYDEDGHYFWVINVSNPFATPPSSWVYDATERAWHERCGLNTGTGALINYLLQSHTFIPQWGGANGKHIVAGQGFSKVYVMSSDTYSFDGSNIKYVRALPYLFNGGKRIFVGRVQLTMDTGEIPSGTEPTIQLDWSEDNGHTFGSAESTGFGTHGQYQKPVYWLAQGSFENNAIPRLSYTGQQAITLIDVDAEVTWGTS